MNRPIANPFVHIENLEIFYAPDQIKNHKTVQVGGTNLYYILVRVSRSATYFMYVLHLEHNGPVNSLWHANSSSLRLAVKSYCARCLLNANNKYAHGTYSLHKLWSHELGHCFWYQTFVNCCRQLSPHVWLSLLRETLARGSWWDTKRNWDFGFTSQMEQCNYSTSSLNCVEVVLKHLEYSTQAELSNQSKKIWCPHCLSRFWLSMSSRNRTWKWWCIPFQFGATFCSWSRSNVAHAQQLLSAFPAHLSRPIKFTMLWIPQRSLFPWLHPAYGHM